MTSILRTLSAFILLVFALNVSGQIYGPELIPEGNFGTTADGKNGDGGVGEDIYPSVPTDIPVYYQPVTQAYHNGKVVNIEINPGVTVGMPLDSESTSYSWGFTEPWQTGNYFFPANHSVAVPNAPNNGNYLIVTSTKGMYNLPSLSIISWYEIFDKYETD